MRHLTAIADLRDEDIGAILDLADRLYTQPERRYPVLTGRTIANVFFEPSTRTRVSFELAARRLGADNVAVAGATSSTVKGETLLDTVKNLAAMKVAGFVVRTSTSGAAAQVARAVDAVGLPVINAGDGLHEHPTQALLDAGTIRRHKRRIAGLTVVIVGDLTHSRVARSNIALLSRLGAKVRVVAPRTLMPVDIEALGCDAYTDLDRALEGAEVIMMLRLQQERLEKQPLLPSLREFSQRYGLDDRRLARLPADVLVMHPGPINRGVELRSSVADDKRAVILDQVTYGVACRMAVLCHAFGTTVPVASA